MFLIALGLPLAYYTVGFVAATQKTAARENLAFQEAVDRHIHGVDLSGKTVFLQRSAVTSSTSPFEVEVTYSVPHDLHATLFIKKFHVSVWGDISAGKLQIIHLV